MSKPHRAPLLATLGGKWDFDLGFTGTTLLTAVTACCALGFTLVGYDNGSLGGLIETPAFKKTFNNPSPDTLGNIVSIYEIGCFFGAMSTFIIGNPLGRRMSIIVGSIWMFFGAIIQAGSHCVGVMIFGRVITGIGMGIINSTVPILQAEMSPAFSRGSLVAIDLTILNCGIALAYWIDYGFNFSNVKESVAWRLPVALQIIFILAIAGIALIIPDTPRWYIANGQESAGLTVLARLKNKDQNDPDVQDDFEEIRETVRNEIANTKTGWVHLFKPGDGWKDDNLRSRRRLLLACFIQAAQQLGGVNALIYYSSTLFKESLGFSDQSAAKLAGALNMTLILGAGISIFLVDRVGRRRLLIPMISAMSIVFACQSGFVHSIQNGTATENVRNAAAAMLFLFQFFFSIGFQATVWMIPSEILPLKIRTRGSALSTASNWICNFIVVKFTPSALANIGHKTYIIFTIFNACWVPVIYFFLPETKGLTLEAVDEIFATDGWHLEHHAVVNGKPTANVA
ncbi:unnamed protein product [Sympodiomycopsis kandeliae]